MMLQLELTNLFVSPKLFKTRKVLKDDAGEITSFEFDKLMWKNRRDLVFCWKVAAITFNLDIGDALNDLHDKIAEHIGDQDLLID